MKPRRAERKPWEMFVVGLVYSSIALLIVSFVFSSDTVLSKYSGILLVLLTVLACLPFMYYIIKLEEGKDLEINETGKLVKEHWKAIAALMWLFLGFVVGFSFWYAVLPGQVSTSFNAQIEVFCSINSPNDYSNCLEQNGISTVTGSATSSAGFALGIFSNNVKVLMVTLIFSLAFGAGAIFILVWNASVIAAAIGMFIRGNLFNLHCGLFRYLIHGIPEIAAYFVAALAGGIVSVAVIRRDLDGDRKWAILQDAIILIVIALLILLISAIMEVYLTPGLSKMICPVV